MFNNDLMADVHFVVGPPGGTQRLPGHKVSNSCITGFALSSPQRDPLPDPRTGLGSSQAVLGFPPSQSRHNLSRGPWPRLLFFFCLCFLLPCFISPTKACPLHSPVMGSCCDRFGKSYADPSPRNQLDMLLFIL